MNSNIYDITYQKLRAWLIPALIRKPRLVALLQVLSFPIEGIYQAFNRYRLAKRYQLKITPQVCYLEMMLNDRYDFVQRRIRIEDSLEKPPLYLFQNAENKPVFLATQYLFTDGEAGAIKDDFVVKVPMDINFENAEMLSLLKNYKLASMKPKIQRI